MNIPLNISESLSGLLHQMTPQQQDKVSEMMAFYYEQYQELIANNQNDRISVAAGIHRAVDQSLQSQIKQATEFEVSCGKGCSFCCFLRVDISNDEADLLTEYAKEQRVEIDYDKLKKQITHDNDDFMKLPAKDRKCVFLSDNGSCRVYKHRPNSCRKLIVVSDPKNCDTENNLGAQVGKLVDVEAEVLTAAALNATASGSMAEMLIKSNLKNK
jgi:Fe-S-cluster containining protein